MVTISSTTCFSNACLICCMFNCTLAKTVRANNMGLSTLEMLKEHSSNAVDALSVDTPYTDRKGTPIGVGNPHLREVAPKSREEFFH